MKKYLKSITKVFENIPIASFKRTTNFRYL